jgi:ribose transport system permease protein
VPPRLSAGPSSARLVLALMKIGPLIVLLALFAVFSAASSKFIEWSNLQNLMQQTTPVALVALGQLFVVLTRGVDLSVGSNVSLCTVIGATVGLHVSGSPVMVILAMVAAGALVGAANAFIIVRLNIDNPFIVTLATLSVVHGVALLVIGNGGSLAGIPSFVETLAVGRVAGVPTAFLLTLVIYALAAVFLSRTVWGRYVYAIGGNPSAAGRVGIPTRAVLTSCYLVAGASAGLAAICIAGRFSSGFPDAGAGLELDTVSAVVIGGASFFGGRGNASAALIGALIIGTIHNGLNIVGVDPNWQLVAIGTILVAALGLDRLKAKVEELTRAAKSRAAEALDETSGRVAAEVTR